jgi:uncharacterized membrane protein
MSFSGWLLESIQESIVRRKLVSKGFFKGPYVPIHGIGGILVYLLGYPFRASPALVCIIGIVVCTAAEYITALFLENCFKIKCWDYSTYPHTKWCHFQGRISLSISLFFGIITLFVVYYFWSFLIHIADFLGVYILFINGFFMGVFVADIIYSCTKIVKLNKAGQKIRGWAVFSNTEAPE